MSSLLMTEQELLQVIKQAVEDRQTVLDLSGMQLTSLPPEIGQLQDLIWLNLSNNKLSNLPPEIGKLQNLTSLDLSKNRLTRLPSEIGQLQNLTSLNLSNNQLNKVRSLPAKIARLQNLTWLNLEQNNLTKIPAVVIQLQNLTWLYLNNNKLENLPAEIAQLKNLSELHLRNNQLADLPAEIIELQQLTKLDLNENLFSLPTGILEQLDQPEVILNFYRQLRIQPETTLNLYRELQEQEEDYLYEAKLIILGEGGAGKTTLAKKILDSNYKLDLNEKSTTGIDVSQWNFYLEDGKQFQVNIWDFSGQEIDHATHQVFLTEQSLYILVVDTRRDNTNSPYWLNIVKLCSRNSPLLIVKNEKQDRPGQINESQLRGQYLNLEKILSTNLESNRGLPEVIEAIQQHIHKLPHVGKPLPKTWTRVREVLEQDPRSHITLTDFKDICQRNGFNKPEDQLIKDLHTIGFCLHFHDEIILKPAWITGAIYEVINNADVIAKRGEFNRSDLKKIWHDERFAEMQEQLLRLMLKFKLCCEISNSSGRYIAPQLLNPDEPSYDWNKSDNLIPRYEYEFMPKGILTCFITKMYKRIDQNNLWKSGVVLIHDATKAEIIEDYRFEKGEITIRIVGEQKRDLFKEVDSAFDEIHHESFQGLKCSKFIPCNCSICQSSQSPYLYRLEYLYQFSDSQDYKIQCYVSRKIVDVRNLLDQVGLLEGNVPKEVFISYAWGEEGEERERIVDQICEKFQERGVKITRDKEVLQFKEKIREFMERIGYGKCIVTVISDKYLKSKNCMFELVQIAKNGRFYDRVFPIVLPDANIYDPTECADYVLHWQNKCDELQDKLNQIKSSANLPRLHREINLYEEIRATIDGLVDILQDMNTLSASKHIESKFDELFKAVESKLAK